MIKLASKFTKLKAKLPQHAFLDLDKTDTKV